MIDLSTQRVIDNHCHCFLPSKESQPFERYLTLSTAQVPSTDLVSTLLYRRVLSELSRVLNYRGDHIEVVKTRCDAYRRDPAAYVRLLFQDARIDTLLIDTGYPSVENVGYSIDLAEFRELVGCALRPIYRIDNTIFSSVRSALSFQEATRALSEQIERSVKREGAVAVKSVAAYYTGLAIEKVAESQAEEAYRSVLSAYQSASKAKPATTPRQVFLSRSQSAKMAMDYFVFLAASKCAELRVPFQIHTGIGDSPVLDLRRSNPLSLYELITDVGLENCIFVFVHCGYPYVEEVGFLANTCPNVYVDLSEMVPFISIGIKDKLLKLLEMAPTTKIMYGSDGFNIPELHWISAVESKNALSAALNGLVGSKVIDEEFASQVGKQILFENAQRIYRL